MRRGYSLRLAPRALLRELGVRQAVGRGLFAASNELRNEWEQTLRQPGTGQIYGVELRTVRRGGRTRVIPVGSRVPHRASAPGKPPATDTGVSANSINVDPSQIERSLRSRVGTNRPHLRFLQWGVGPGFEFGPHPAGIVIAPRPHADVAAAKADLKMKRAFFNETRRR